jgi:lipoate-protein ligase A
MDDVWRVLPFEIGHPAFNMALDHALLEHAASLGRPVLRFYGWTEPASTFGCSQRYEEVAAATALRPLIRRPTGGGLVPHGADWTYSVVIPPGHAWYALRATESYCRIHQWIRDAFGRLRIDSALAPVRDLQAAGRCFAGGWEQHDLVRDGRKVAGAAQRRNRSGLLIQGSVQPLPPGIHRAAWEEAMLATAAENAGAVWTPLVSDSAWLTRAAVLVESHYINPAHNESR